MESFTDLKTRPALRREAEHGGVGSISFRRLMDNFQFHSALDFVDFTVIPPGSSIGKHFHSGSEELYFVVNGEPLICVNGRDNRGKPGTLAIVRSGEWHSLINDTSSDVTILVIQARVQPSYER
jgi:mannose-6-phosphate isomerase-like protein (cupin superfamily)